MAIIASQLFDEIGFNATVDPAVNTDSLPNGSALTNIGAFNSNPDFGLLFQTFWGDSRGVGLGPVVDGESGDFIGVNSFTGSNSPDVDPDGNDYSSSGFHNYEFNDGDGALLLVFEPVNLTNYTNRSLTVNYWINETGYEADDRFIIAVDDGTNIVSLLDFGETELEANTSVDDGTANWNTLTVDLDNLINQGFGEQVALTIAVDNNAAAENIFVDNILFESDENMIDDDITLISEIQGSGASSPLVGEIVTVEGIVIGDFQDSTGTAGFFVQEEDTDSDGNGLTSEGIFIFDPGGTNVEVGDKVRVTGTADEFFNKTQIDTVTEISIEATDQFNLVTPTVINLPVEAVNELEAYEGMLVTFPQTLAVTDSFNLGRFGELTLSVSDPLRIPTNTIDPNDSDASDNNTETTPENSNVEEVTEQIDLNQRSQIILDDGSQADADDLEDPIFGEPLGTSDVPYINRTEGEAQTIRRGTTLENLTGVLDFNFGRYRLQRNPYNEADLLNTEFPLDFNYAPRPTVPEVGGDLKIASFNVLNYFTTLDNGSNGARGADSSVELERQQAKIIAALAEIDADIVGLVEIENNEDVAISNLVDALNAEVGEGTYDFISQAPNFETVPGSTDAIQVGFIYKPENVTPVGDAIAADSSAFDFPPGGRAPIAQTFAAEGEEFTVVVNHFKSKGGNGSGADADQGDGQGQFNATRKQQAQAVADFVEQLQTATGDNDVLVIGDLNAYGQEDPIDLLRSEGLIDLVDEFVPASEQYSFVFFGAQGYLDHALATPSLSEQITGTAFWQINADEPRTLDYNDDILDLPNDNFEDINPDPSLYEPDPFRSSDHDPVIVGLDLSSDTSEPFTLQLLHASDQEAGLPAIQDAIGFSAVLNALADDFANTLKLSSGDIFIAGPFFNTSREVYGDPGIADILINNALGWDAVAIGNHEWDAGPDTFNALIRPDDSITGPGIDGTYLGTAFPYLSTNLDFTGEPDLQDLVVPDGNAPLPNSITGSVVLEVGGEQIGVIGAVTPTLPQIANVGGVTLDTPDPSLSALAADIQAAVDALTATGINKVVLLAHMQQISVEEELATLLEDVDVIMAGGSNTILANDDDTLRPGDTAAGLYPEQFTSAKGEPVVVVNTDGNYRYVGRLAVDFDENGLISLIREESGIFATDQAGVEQVYNQVGIDPKTVADPTIVEVTEAIDTVVQAKDGNVFGLTDVYLNGRRGSVRTEETNLGNLTADANLFIAQQYDETVQVSLKNGGGIRDDIGTATVPPGSTSGELVTSPPAANPNVTPPKPEGGVSQLDIENSLRFNNDLALVTLSATELKDVLEHAVAATSPDSTPGQFAQVGGISFSFDATRQAIAFERDSATQVATGVLTEGDRIRNAALLNEEGEVVEILVQDGEVVGDPNRPIRVVTLGFLADGGDGYPYPLYAEDRVNLIEQPLPTDGVDVANFTDDGTEQDALAEYLAANFPVDNDPNTPIFDTPDVSPEEDTRIQNLGFREDTVLDDVIEMPEPLPSNVFGTSGDDDFDTEVPDDKQFRGDEQRLFTGSGNDRVDVTFAPGGNRIDLGSGDDLIFAGTDNRIIAGSGDDILFLGSAGGNNLVTGGAGSDQFWIVTDTIELPTEANTITDFISGEDVIGFGATDLTFDALTLTQDGNSAVINALGQDLAILLNTQTTNLSASDFAFA